MIKKIYRRLQIFFVPVAIKKNFRLISNENKYLLAEKIKDIYIPTISSNTSEEKLLFEVQEHLESRVIVDRMRVIPWLSKNLKLENLHILEIGCGTGSSSITLAEQGAKVVGIDIHKESLEIAKYRSEVYNLDIEFIESSSVDIDKLDKNFDAIILYATLEHLTFEERLITLKNCKKILDDQGYIIIIEAQIGFGILILIHLNYHFFNGSPMTLHICILNLALRSHLVVTTKIRIMRT